MKQRRIAAVLAGSLMAVTMGAYAAPAAHADGGGGGQRFTPDPESAAIAHWTPSAMRNAKPVVINSAEARKTVGESVEVGKQRVIRAANASEDTTAQRQTRTGGAWTKGGKVVKTTGKVFFTIPRGEPGAGDYVCSGSVAPANNKSIIITAAHCVNDANEHQDAGDGKAGKYVTNWVFVPGYNARSKKTPAPYGMYSATKLRAAARWINRGDFNYDVGFATVGRESGGKTPGALVQNAQGSQSLGFNLPRHKYVENFGYPQVYPYDGTRLDYSAGPALNADANGTKKGNSARHDDPNGSNDQVVKSNLTGGSSGGPWFYRFDESHGIGTQMSVNSFSYQGLSKRTRTAYKIPKYNMWGPYFGTAIENMFDSVQGRAPRAASKSTTTPEDTPTKIVLSGTKSSASDPEPLSYRITSQPSHGKLSKSGRVVTYTPNKNFNGTDRFSYVANNGVSNSARATVTIKVTPVEDTPRAADTTAHTRTGTPVRITLDGTDPDKTDKLTYTVVAGPSDGGRVTTRGDVATYTPADGTGASTAQKVSFRYTVSDGHRSSRPATVTVTVKPDSAPVGRDDSYAVDAGRTLSVTAPGVLRNDTDADGDTLSAVLVGQAPDGLHFHSDGSFRYHAPTTYKNKTVTFTYKATDGVQDPSAQLAMSAPRRTTLDYSGDVTVTIAVAAAQRPAPQPRPTHPPSTPQPKPSPSGPASSAPSSQAPSGPLGDTGSPFSPALVVFGLLTVAAGAGTLIAARLRRS